MATFPSLTPSSRTYTPGQYPHTAFTAWSGAENRVRHSNVMLDARLRLSFSGLSEAQMLSVLSHYQGQRGGYESFALPSDVWSGITATSTLSPYNYRWRYDSPPVVTDLPCGGHIVELTLATVPPEGSTVNGITSSVLFSFAGGSVAVSNGITKTVQLAFAPGKGDAAVNAAGATLTVTCSLASAGVGGGAAGLSSTVTASFQGGDASNGTSLNQGFDLTALFEDDLLTLIP